MIIDAAFLRSMNVDPSHFDTIIGEHSDLASLVPFKVKVRFFDGTRSVETRAIMENYVKYLVSSIESGEKISPAHCKSLALRAYENAEAVRKNTNSVKPEPAENSEPEVVVAEPRKIGKLDPNLLGRFEKK